MVNPNRFYTYAYLREDRTPYYIGKGIKYRIYSTNRKGLKPPKDKTRIVFLKQNLTEEEAFKHEIYMIAVFGRKDIGTGILHNKTDGGDGAFGAVRSEETRKKLSEVNKGKNNPNYGKSFSNEHRKKLSEAHKGKVLSEEHRRKNSEAKKGLNNPNYGKKGAGPKLRENMVIAIEPMINLGTKDVIYDEDGWTVRTRDGKFSAHYEHTICIKKNKADILSSFSDIIQQEKNNPSLFSEY